MLNNLASRSFPGNGPGGGSGGTITGGGSAGLIPFWTGANSIGANIYFNRNLVSGFVGMGILTPLTNLHIENQGGGSTRLLVTTNETAIGDYEAQVVVGNAIEPSMATFGVTSNNFSGGTGFLPNTAYMLALEEAGGLVFGSTRNIGYISFFTAGEDPAAFERMRIDQFGNVGIGITSPNIKSMLHVNGSQSVKRQPVSATYGVSLTDFYVGVTSTAAPRIMALPLASLAGNGKIYHFKDESGAAGTNNITVDCDGSDTIDGAPTYVINTNYGSVKIISSGSAWFVI